MPVLSSITTVLLVIALALGTAGASIYVVATLGGVAFALELALTLGANSRPGVGDS